MTGPREGALDRIAALSPRSEPPDSLAELEPFLDGDPRRLAAAADGAGIVAATAVAVAAAGLGRPSLSVVAVGAGLAVGALVRGALVAVGNARRSAALGGAPTVVGRAVLRMRIAPALEEAAAFAARADGRLADRLRHRVRQSRGTPESGIGALADAWRGRFPALYRSLSLLEAAANAPEGERGRTLDRATETILDGTRSRATEAADSLRGPSTAVYAFGVLLPLALVSVLPAAGAAGIDATLPAVIVLYDVVLPAGLVCASGWLLANRPVAFPPAEPPPVATRWPLVVGAGVGAAAVAGTAAWRTIAGWAVPLVAIGAGTGTALLARYRPVVAVRKRAAELERSLPDGLYLVGRRVAEGIAVERAVADAAAELEGVAGETFGAAARRQRQLRIGVEAAFVGEHGALEGVPSRRAESAAELLGVAARAGAPAGRALIETADHLDELRRVETDARRELGSVTSTLSNTAAFFGPLIGGATVALSDSVGTTDALGGSAPGTAELGLAVGAYVLLMAAILAALSTGLRDGIDRATIGYRVGAALVAATVTYPLAVAATGAVAGGL